MDKTKFCVINSDNREERENIQMFMDISSNECPEVFGLENHPDCSNVNCVGEDICWHYALTKKKKKLDEEWE